jgi:hypothetical protein
MYICTRSAHEKGGQNSVTFTGRDSIRIDYRLKMSETELAYGITLLLEKYI